jgi:DNA-binding response OmpR family regulator
MTGYASIESAVRTTKLGAFEYITKPFTPEELREVTDRAIKNFQSLDTPDTVATKKAADDKIDVDIPFSATEVDAQTSRKYTDHLTRGDIAPSQETFPPGYCVKGNMVCARFKKQNGACEGECPILARRQRKTAPVLTFGVEDSIDVDLPFSLKELEELTSPEYVTALGRCGVPLAARLPKVDEDLLRKVLVVDDESVVCNSVRKILTRRGYQVEGTDDGREALKRIRRSDYDLVILDMVMPKMNGLDVLKEIKTRRPETRVVIVTGYASIETAKDAIRLGATDYLPKPFTPDELVRTASEAVAA